MLKKRLQLKNLNKILRAVFLPVLIGSLVTITAYTSLNYFLVIKYEVIEPKEMLLNFWIPFGLAFLFAYLFVRPRVNFLVAQENTREGITVVGAVLLLVPLIIAQHFIDVANGKLTVLNSTTEIEWQPETKYYEIDHYHALKNYGSLSTSRRTSNRYGTEITVTAYFVCPMIDTLKDYQSPKDFNVWIGKDYHEQFSNRKWDKDAQPKEIQEFIDISIEEYEKYDFHPHSYFKLLTNSEDRDNYLQAIERIPNGKELAKDAIILVPEKGKYESREGNKVGWFIGTLLFGHFLFLSLIIHRGIKTNAIKKFKNLDPKGRINQSLGLLVYLIPTKSRLNTALIIDANIIVLLIMVISGVSIISPQGSDLIAWGALFKPLVQEGEYWRLFTSTFIHIGVFHLVFNIIALGLIGYQLDKELTFMEYLSFYLITGILASATSLIFHDNTISAGASGAILGMYGVGLSMLVLNYGSSESHTLFGIGLFIIVGSTLIMGLITPSDNSAHFGGFLSGFILGFIYFGVKKYSNETDYDRGT